MLEAKDLKAIDMVCPIIGGYIDRACGETSNCPTTKIFTRYCDIVNTVFRRRCRNGWTSEELNTLSDNINSFKLLCIEIYAEYQPSEMRTLKFHLLDHLVDDLRRLGTVDVKDAGLFEYSHTLFKKKYHGTSRRHSTAMEESIREIHRENVYSKFKQSNESGNVPKEIRNLSCVPRLPRDGPTFSLEVLLEARNCILNSSTESKTRGFSNEPAATATQLVKDIGVEATMRFVNLIKTWWNNTFDEDVPTRKPIIRRVTSAFVVGWALPTSSDSHCENNVLQLREADRPIQNRIVSASNFCNNGIVRQDCVVLGPCPEFPDVEIGMAKALLLFRIRRRDEEYCKVFVRHFPPIASEDEIDMELKCLKMQWGVRHERGAAVPKLTIEPIEMIHGSVNVVTTDYNIRGV